MITLPPLGIEDFALFFRTVHGCDPFPWQDRLARQVAEKGWPEVLDLPTGSGKTAALDVALFALAHDAGRTPRSAPMRIVYVVDRRTIVDQAYERAKKLRAALVGRNEDVLRRVRDRLSQYASDRMPLQIAQLRGCISTDDRWARTPDQPVIAVSTVDQVGSRLLFRGYGVTDSMKPVHAGLLGCDVLYLLDEVHLSQPFRETLAAIAGRYRKWAERPLPSAFTVVEMSATPGGRSPVAFRLGAADRRDETLSVRLRTSKPVRLASPSPRRFLQEIEQHVLSMLDRPAATVAVVLNRVKDARELHARLSEVVPGGSSVVRLLTGRMRPFDRDALERSIFERVRAGRTRNANDQPIVVVSTQAIEVGADFDFDDLVAECASLDALRQRFGRLDRMGELAGSARGVVVVRSNSLRDDAVYGDAIGKTWDWLRARAGEGDVVDFGIDAFTMPDDACEQGLLTPRPHAPILLPSHLDAWVQTAPIPDPDPGVGLWLHGPERGDADVHVVWRADLTEQLLILAADGDGAAAMAAADVAIGMVESFPPVSSEAMAVSFAAAKRWLDGRSEPDSFDVEGAANLDETPSDTTPDSVPRVLVLWQGEQSRVVRSADLRPGQTIVVPSSYGGVQHSNWAPASRVPVKDVAELASLRQGKTPKLRLHQSVVQSLLDDTARVPEPDSSEDEAISEREIVARWLDSVSVPDARDGLSDLLDQLRRRAAHLRIDRLPSTPGEDPGEYFLIVGRSPQGRADEGVGEGVGPSTSSFTGVEVTLGDHLSGVADTAAGFAERVGLPDDVVSDLRLAAEWHDAGKADPRFQRWLHGGSEFKALVHSALLAKGATRFSGRAGFRLARERAGYPAGGRHELTSAALLESAWETLEHSGPDWQLVQHLVTSHHGYCRPLAPWVPDSAPLDVTFSWNGITSRCSSAHGLERLDSGIADRFWQMVRRYGWWGLAWLEAMLRLADHRQSEREQLSRDSRHA